MTDYGITKNRQSCFPDPLDIRDLGNGKDYRLLEKLQFATGAIAVTVPAGFVTDFASVPRMLWRLFPPAGVYNRAAVVHDFLYRTGLTSRAVADALFLDAMIEIGVPWLVRWLMYIGVRIGGRSSYRAPANETKIDFVPGQKPREPGGDQGS
ncbi:MAG: DUF1353 domain-containing protein [Gemmatimonadota bacterium]|nr:DUF1353 domain-containing protein [Gemmatimonadota bacterium]